MKQLHFLLLLVFSSFISILSSQSLPYQYAFWKETFTPLSNPTIFPQTVWQQDVVTIPLGFSFQLGEQSNSTLELAPYDGGLYINYAFGNFDTLQGIFGYDTYAGLVYKPGAQIGYKVEGTAPNRIFKAEWLKAGFDFVDGEVSFQIWVYETSNTIQIKLGPQNVPDPANTFFNAVSPLCGLGLDLVSTPSENVIIGYGHWVSGEAQAPTDTILYNFLTLDAPEFGCNGIPIENAVFTFTPANTTSTQTPTTRESLVFFPNPATEKIYFEEALPSEALVQMLDSQGHLVFSEVLQSGATGFQWSGGLPAGAYVIRRVMDGKMSIGKIMLL